MSFVNWTTTFLAGVAVGTLYNQHIYAAYGYINGYLAALH